MSKVVEILAEKDFGELLVQDKPVLVDFWATWCGPCKMQAPVFHQVSEELGDRAIFAQVDVDVNEKLAYELGIVSIPTIMLFKNGELVEKSVGLTTAEQLKQMVEKAK